MSTRSCGFLRSLCVVLVLIQPLLASSGENKEPESQSFPEQAKGSGHSADGSSAQWETIVECLLAGDSDCALEHLDQIIEKDPEAWGAYTFRAKVRDQTGDRAGAESDRNTLEGVGVAYAAIEDRLSTAIDQDPTDPERIWHRAIHRWQVGNDVEGALSDLNRVIELNDGVASRKVHMMRAKLLEVQGDYASAILDYSTVIDSSSGHEATALTERARLLNLVGRTADTERDLDVLADWDRARVKELAGQQE